LIIISVLWILKFGFDFYYLKRSYGTIFGFDSSSVWIPIHTYVYEVSLKSKFDILQDFFVSKKWKVTINTSFFLFSVILMTWDNFFKKKFRTDKNV